jgi:preprotein translocase subunit SecF
VLVGTYTSVFIASPILIYLGVGANRMGGGAEEPEPPEPQTAATPPQRARTRR